MLNKYLSLIIICCLIIYPLGITMIIYNVNGFMSLLILIVLIIVPSALYQANKEDLLNAK